MTTTNGKYGHEKNADELSKEAFSLRSVGYSYMYKYLYSFYIFRGPYCQLIFLSVVVMATTMTPGNGLIFASIAVPQMHLNLDESSWFTSLPVLTMPFGMLFIGLTLDAYGRRICMFVYMILNTIGWFLLADKQVSLTQLYAGRLLIGFALGSCNLPCVVYVAESITCNNVQIRSTVGTWVIFSYVIGGLLMYVLSLILTYDRVALVCGILSAISFISILIFIPESPAWLYAKGRISEAEAAQRRLRIRQPSVVRDQQMLPSIDIDVSPTANNKAAKDSCSLKSLCQYLGQIKRRDVYKPLIITTTFFFLCCFSGIYSLLSSMVTVITVSPLESQRYTLCFVGQIIQIFGCLLLSFTLPHYGVKVLSVISFLGSCASYLVLAISILLENQSSPNVFNYLHVLSVWSTTLASQLGILSIPHAILGELFPIGAKGYATITLFSSSFFTFLVLKIFPYALARYRNVLFFACSVVCAVGAMFVAVCLPETVGRTLQEINEGFGKPTKIIDDDVE